MLEGCRCRICIAVNYPPCCFGAGREVVFCRALLFLGTGANAPLHLCFSVSSFELRMGGTCAPRENYQTLYEPWCLLTKD